MKVYRMIFCALLAVWTISGNAQMREMPIAFEQWLDTPGMRHATVAVEVVDLDSGRTRYAYDEQRFVQPASLLKLVTTATALRKLGGDFVIYDSINCAADTTSVSLPGLEGYNPDWLIEDVNASYIKPLTHIPDVGLSLREFVKKTNEKSLNENAESLLYFLSPEHTLQAGLDTVKAYWHSRGLDTDALLMYDGCGLAPNDRITARFISQLLSDMKDDEDFRASLAIAGLTGTVTYFLKSSHLAGRAFLKTGTTKAVTAYAGYMIGRDDHTYSVVLIVNNSTAPLTNQRKNIEKMFNLLVP